MLCLFCDYFILISPSFGGPGRLYFVILAFSLPGIIVLQELSLRLSIFHFR